jgi:6-phosphofructokinase 1
VRTSNTIDSYRSAFARADLSAVARHARHMPDDFVAGSNNVSAAFYEYCQPLVGDLPDFERL